MNQLVVQNLNNLFTIKAYLYLKQKLDKPPIFYESIDFFITTKKR